MAARITPQLKNCLLPPPPLAAVWAGLSFPLLITAGDNKIQARPICSENQQRERRNSTPSVISRFGVSGFVDSEADDWWQAATHTQRRKFHSKVTSQHFRPPAGGPSRGTHLDRRRPLSAYENQNKQNKTKRPGPMNVLLELDTRLPIWRRSDLFPVATRGTASENPTGTEKLQYKNKDLYNSWQDASDLKHSG